MKLYICDLFTTSVWKNVFGADCHKHSNLKVLRLMHGWFGSFHEIVWQQEKHRIMAAQSFEIKVVEWSNCVGGFHMSAGWHIDRRGTEGDSVRAIICQAWICPYMRL